MIETIMKKNYVKAFRTVAILAVLLTVAWLYRSAVNEGMNKSLWPILGLFTNLLAAFAFMIIRDRPGRTAASKA